MSLYDPLWRDFWSPGSKGHGKSAIAKMVYVYGFSNPRCSAAGIYPFDVRDCVDAIGPKIFPPPADLDFDVDLTMNLVTAALAELESDPAIIRYDPATGVIWIIGKWKRSAIKSANHKRRVGTEFLMSSAYPFWFEFFQKYTDVFAFLNRPKSYKKQPEFKHLFEGLRPSVPGNPSGRIGKDIPIYGNISFPIRNNTDPDPDAARAETAAAPDQKPRKRIPDPPPPGNIHDPDPVEAKSIINKITGVDPAVGVDKSVAVTVDTETGSVQPSESESERRDKLLKQIQAIHKRENGNESTKTT